MKPDLTKKGTPRQRAPGAGRPEAHRKTILSRVSAECREQLKAIAAARQCTAAEAIEQLVSAAHSKLK